MKVVDKYSMNKIIVDNDMKNLIKDTNAISIYNNNNWDHLVMHWGEENENDTPSYIDFFFDSAYMVKFFMDFLNAIQFDYAYISAIFPKSYKIKTNNDDVSRDIYDEHKRLYNKLGLRVNTSKAIKMNKNEIIKWCDRFSIAGFMGLSELYLIIPNSKMIIEAHHHMNYIIYTDESKKIMKQVNEILCNNDKKASIKKIGDN